MQCRGIGRQLQQLSSDSTPHDRVTIPQICLARSPALDRPRQSTLRYPTGVSNRPTGHHARRDPLPIHQPLHRPPTRCGGSIPITNISRGSQISITPVARPSVPLRAVSSLGGFRTPTAELAAPSLMRPASETLHKGGRGRQVDGRAGLAPVPEIPGRSRTYTSCATRGRRRRCRSWRSAFFEEIVH